MDRLLGAARSEDPDAAQPARRAPRSEDPGAAQVRDRTRTTLA